MNLFTISKYLLLALFMVIMAPANASGGLTGPASSTTGSYTIASINNVCGTSILNYKLLENNSTVQTGCAISKSFTGKPAGTYQYVLKECEYDSESGQTFCMSGANHTVIVSGGGGTNPNGDNDVHLGDYNNDGRLDIFVGSTVSSPYVLQQLSNTSFQLVSGLTSSQVSAYSSWPLTNSILVHQSDLNADGTDDLMLVDVSSHIAGANDQVIFSQYNGVATTSAASVSALTASKRQFLVETLGLSQDPDYLLRTMIEQGAFAFISHGFATGYFNAAYLQLFGMAYNGNLYVGLNDNPYDQNQTPPSCAIYNCQFSTTAGQWTMYVYAEVIETVFDYSIFDAQTVVLGNEMDRVEAGTSTLDNLLSIIEGVIGPVSCNGIEIDQINVFDSVHNFDYFKTNTCSFAVLARYLNGFSIKDIINEGHKRIQFRVSKLENWWAPFYHASISHSSLEQWISAFPNSSNKLDDKLNAPGDDPSITLFAGYITGAQDPEVAFAKLISAEKFYGDWLDYTKNPLPFTSSYNSNSFAQGLVNLIGTFTPADPYEIPRRARTTAISINSIRLPGLYKPVPKNEFGF